MSNARLVIPLGPEGVEGILSISVDSEGDVCVQDDREGDYTIDRADWNAIVNFVNSVTVTQ